MSTRGFRRSLAMRKSLSFSSAFWSTLAIMLHDALGLGSATARAFGLAGAAGALAAPIAGRLAGRRDPQVVTCIGAALAAASFALMGLGTRLGVDAQLALLVVGTIGFDLRLQATLIAHQTIVYGVEPEARSRLNAILFTGIFLGMAAGAAVGSMVLASWGWLGVAVLSGLASLAALGVRLFPTTAKQDG